MVISMTYFKQLTLQTKALVHEAVEVVVLAQAELKGTDLS
jgi:hypothetical protein